MKGTGIKAGQNFGHRKTFADIGQTIADLFDVPAMNHGTAMW
jgi:phosphopentomutase